MVHVEFIDGFFNSIWGFVQALCAIVMAIFTWKLFQVSQRQVAIATAQQKLMEQANKTNVDLERGSIIITKAEWVGEVVTFHIKNIGRARVQTKRIAAMHFTGYVPGGSAAWEDVPQYEYQRALEGGQEDFIRRLNMFEVLKPPDWQAGIFMVAVRITYCTLGEERAYRCTIIFLQDSKNPHLPMMGDFMPGEGYAYDHRQDEEPTFKYALVHGSKG